jgi:hypothetical protein
VAIRLYSGSAVVAWISVNTGGFPWAAVAGTVMMYLDFEEYGGKQRPRAVAWLYFDGNDISDLHEKELRSAFLLQYLDDKFSQNLMERQGDVDRFWRGMTWSAPAQEFANSAQMKEQWAKKLDENLPLVRKLLGNDITSLQDDENLIRIFTRVLTIAKRRIEAWGGKLYIVLVPNMDDYRSGGVSKYRFPILNELRRLGIQLIDVDQAVRAAGDPLQFFPVRDDWGHFNAKGYRLMARQIMARLDQDFPVPGAKPAQASAPAPKPAVEQAPPAPIVVQPARARAEYANFGNTSAIIPANRDSITPSSGASVLGLTFSPTRAKSLFKVRVVMNGYATESNDFVVAVFRRGKTSPVSVLTRPAGAGQRVTIDETFDFKTDSLDQIDFDVRVGLARSGGEVYVNSDPKGRNASLPIPFIEVRETN